jgi:acyl carrier protein
LMHYVSLCNWLGVETPEQHYRKIATLRNWMKYIKKKRISPSLPDNENKRCK